MGSSQGIKLLKPILDVYELEKKGHIKVKPGYRVDFITAEKNPDTGQSRITTYLPAIIAAL